nr:unnamed protein product [Callosobruchus analis]
MLSAPSVPVSMSVEIWDDILYLNNIDEKLTLLNRLIVQLFDKHAPVRTARITKPYAPWITCNVKRMMRERDIALQKYKQTKSVADYSNYAMIRNLVLSTVRKEKAAYLSTKLNTGPVSKMDRDKNKGLRNGDISSLLPGICAGRRSPGECSCSQQNVVVVKVVLGGGRGWGF